MENEKELFDLIAQREEVLKEANDKQKEFFETAVSKLSVLTDVLSKYKMTFLQVPFAVQDSYGIFSTYGKSNLIITTKGVGLLDVTKDSSDKTRFVEISLNSYKKCAQEQDQGDMINIVTYIVQNLDALKNAEFECIKEFYQKQLDQAKENSAGWTSMVQSIA